MRPGPLVHPEKLAEFLRDDEPYPGSAVESAWTPGDYVAMWEMMLRTDLCAAFSTQSLADASTAQRLGLEAMPAIETIGQLLRHPRPPIELLRMTKELAKRDAAGREGGLPKAIALTLYHATIFAARVRLNLDISSLSPDELRLGAQRLVGRGWLDKDTVELAAQFVRQS